MTVVEAIKEAIKHAEGVMDENLEITKEEALEQEPCDDCISRQAVLKLVNEDWKYEGLESDIENLPPVTPQPKMGRWIGHREHCENLGVMPSGLGAYEWCSNCDCGIDVIEWHRNNYNFCPNCGAKMQEVEE